MVRKKRLPKNALQVVECFVSLQGEGPDQGYPVAYIRLAGCNLRCAYCDTRYSWQRGRNRALADLLRWSKRQGVRRVHLTGGEPLLQPGVAELARRLLAAGFSVSLNTNGTVELAALPRQVTRIVDLKGPSSGFRGPYRRSFLTRLRRGDRLHCVVADRRDYLFYREKLRAWRLLGRLDISMSPVWKKLAPRRLAGWILRDKLPVRLQLQYHKLLGCR